MLADIITGFHLVLRLDVFGSLLIGVILGVIVGALPGLTAAMAVSILLPLTFFVSPILGIPFLVAVTKGAIYGGSIPAILINAPGTGAAAATVLDGYPLAQQGKARKALELALYSSTAGDSISDIITLFGIGFLAKIALMVGFPEYFSIILWSFLMIGVLTGRSITKGLIAAFGGLFLSTVGLDPLFGLRRFTFGNLDLTAGFSIVPMIIGLFAFAQVLRQGEIKLNLNDSKNFSALISNKMFTKKEEGLTLKEFRGCVRTILKSSIIGTIIGNIPGIGQVPAAFVCYGVAKASSKHPEKFGKGALEGVAAAETGNNAVNGASLMPLLTLGIPGDIITAILLTALMVQGLRPGPLLFTTDGPVVYGILWALLFSNFILLGLGYFALRYVAIIARFPKQLLFPTVASLCFVGSYAINNSLFDVLGAISFGALGYVMNKFEFPIAPMLITFILGPLFESSFGQSINLSHGSFLIFLYRPISLAFIILIPITLVFLIKYLPKANGVDV